MSRCHLAVKINRENCKFHNAYLSKTILGGKFAVENLVLNHVRNLFPMLGLGQSLVLSAAPYVQKGTKRLKGCQIDLLIQTERTLFVVEIKRRAKIDHSIIAEVEDKIRAFKHDRRLSVRTALVYDGDLVASVPASRFFDFLIPAEELFGLKLQPTSPSRARP